MPSDNIITIICIIMLWPDCTQYTINVRLPRAFVVEGVAGKIVADPHVRIAMTYINPHPDAADGYNY